MPLVPALCVAVPNTFKMTCMMQWLTYLVGIQGLHRQTVNGSFMLQINELVNMAAAAKDR